MTTIYIKNNGVKTEVEVTEQVAEVMKEGRRAEWRNEAKAKYYNTSMNAIESEGAVFYREEDSTEDLMIKRETKQKESRNLRAAMKTLSGEQRKIVQMRFVEKMELQEIADEIGVTYQAIQNRLNKIIKKLKNNFK